MPDASSTVELKLKWVLDGGRLRPLEQSAAAVKDIARAEDELARATARTTEAMARQAHAARAATAAGPAAPSRADIAADLVRRGADYSGRPDPRQEAVRAALRGRTLYEQRLADLAARRQDADKFAAFMAARGLTPTGDPLPAERGLAGRALEAVGGRMGLSAGTASRVGPYALAATPVAVGKMALDQYVEARQIDATPFLAPYQAREQKLRNLPLGAGRLYGYYEDTRAALAGDLDARRASAEYRVLEPARARLHGEYRSADDAYNAERGMLANRAAAYAGLQLDRRTSTERESPAGQRRYEEESRLLPARQRLTVATRDRAAAEKNMADALEVQADRERKLEDAREKYDKAELRRKKAAGRPTDVDDNTPGWRVAGAALGAASSPFGAVAMALDAAGSGQTEYMKADAERETARERFDQAQRLADEARKRTDARSAELTAARKDERVSKYEVTQAEYANAVRKEQEARQGSRDLAGMGVGGRETVKVLADMAKQFGIEALPPEHQAMLEAAAPETVGKWKEKAGERYKDEFRSVFPDEPRYQPTAAAAKRVDALEEKGIGQRQDFTIREAEETVRKVDEMRKALNDQFGRINVAIQNIISDRMAANIQMR